MVARGALGGEGKKTRNGKRCWGLRGTQTAGRRAQEAEGAALVLTWKPVLEIKGLEFSGVRVLPRSQGAPVFSGKLGQRAGVSSQGMSCGPRKEADNIAVGQGFLPWTSQGQGLASPVFLGA